MAGMTEDERLIARGVDPDKVQPVKEHKPPQDKQ